MNKFGVREYTEDDYKEFFEWLLGKEVNMNYMFDITLIDSHEEPKIYYPDEIKKILETQVMQRLKRVTQLGSSLFVNDDYYQTRFAHSVGTGNNAQKFFLKLYKDNSEWKDYIERNGKKEEILADIIHMYLHDIGHNVLSHTLENLIKGNEQSVQAGAAHEILGRRIINEDEELVSVFNSISPTLIKTLNKVLSPSYDLLSLKEGAIDFDRLDYLIRDALYHGTYEDRYITEKIIDKSDISVINSNGTQKQIPVISDEAQDNVSDFLQRRKIGYQNNYWSNESIVFDRLATYFCNKIAIGDFECDLKHYISHCIKYGGSQIDLDEFKAWDDTRFYSEVINIAQNHPDSEIRELAICCLPSLTGLTNFVFEAYDLDHKKSEDELTDFQRNFFEQVKWLVKCDSPLHRTLLKKNNDNIVFLDAKCKSDVHKIIDELEKAGIKKSKLYSLISWSQTRSVYDPQEPIYLQNSSGEILPLQSYMSFFNTKNDIQVDGILAFPMQMRENGFSTREIEVIQNRFRSYNSEHQIKKNGLNSTLKDCLECVNNMRENEEK